VGASFEKTIALERDEVVVHGAGRGQSDGIRDLADGRRVAALLHGASNTVEDALPPFGVVPGHVTLRISRKRGRSSALTVPERMF